MTGLLAMTIFSLGHFIRDKWRGKKQGLSERVGELEREAGRIGKDAFLTLFSAGGGT